MNNKSAKILCLFFLASIISLFVNLYYSDKNEEIKKIISMKENMLMEKHFPDLYKKHKNGLLSYDEHYSYGIHIVFDIHKMIKDEITKKDKYNSILKLSGRIFVLFLTLSILFSTSLLLRHIKKRCDMATSEQRIGFVFIVSSLMLTVFTFFFFYIIDGFNIYKRHETILFVYLLILGLGVSLYFNCLSSLIQWVKVGKRTSKDYEENSQKKV